MCNGKRPTRRQRMLMEKHLLNSDNWLILKNPPGELYMVHRNTGKKRVVKYPLT